MAVGGLLALTRDALKQVLAYSTIAQYGYVVVLLGLGGAVGAAGACLLRHRARSGQECAVPDRGQRHRGDRPGSALPRRGALPIAASCWPSPAGSPPLASRGCHSRSASSRTNCSSPRRSSAGRAYTALAVVGATLTWPTSGASGRGSFSVPCAAALPTRGSRPCWSPRSSCWPRWSWPAAWSADHRGARRGGQARSSRRADPNLRRLPPRRPAREPARADDVPARRRAHRLAPGLGRRRAGLCRPGRSRRPEPRVLVDPRLPAGRRQTASRTGRCAIFRGRIATVLDADRRPARPGLRGHADRGRVHSRHAAPSPICRWPSRSSWSRAPRSWSSPAARPSGARHGTLDRRL